MDLLWVLNVAKFASAQYELHMQKSLMTKIKQLQNLVVNLSQQGKDIDFITVWRTVDRFGQIHSSPRNHVRAVRKALKKRGQTPAQKVLKDYAKRVMLRCYGLRPRKDKHGDLERKYVQLPNTDEILKLMKSI